MKDYKFKLVRQLDLVIPAMSEEEAWVEITRVNPELVADGWTISLLNGYEVASQVEAPIQEPFHDAMSEIDAFDDLSYLNPKAT
jgi:hypothetical protein